MSFVKKAEEDGWVDLVLQVQVQDNKRTYFSL